MIKVKTGVLQFTGDRNTYLHKDINQNHSLGKFSRWETDDIFLVFPKVGIDISCIPSKETFCMKCQAKGVCMHCQSIFSEKKIKNISKCCLLKVLSNILSIIYKQALIVWFVCLCWGFTAQSTHWSCWAWSVYLATLFPGQQGSGKLEKQPVWTEIKNSGPISNTPKR